MNYSEMKWDAMMREIRESAHESGILAALITERNGGLKGHREAIVDMHTETVAAYCDVDSWHEHGGIYAVVDGFDRRFDPRRYSVCHINSMQRFLSEVKDNLPLDDAGCDCRNK